LGSGVTLGGPGGQWTPHAGEQIRIVCTRCLMEMRSGEDEIVFQNNEEKNKKEL